MTDMPEEGKKGVDADIEEIAAILGRLSLTPAPKPSMP